MPVHVSRPFESVAHVGAAACALGAIATAAVERSADAPSAAINLRIEIVFIFTY